MEIYRKESEQLLHSYEWFKQEYPSKEGRPYLIHPATDLDEGVVFLPEGRVITAKCLDRFVTAVRSYVSALVGMERAQLTDKEVHKQLEVNGLLFHHCFRGAQKVK